MGERRGRKMKEKERQYFHDAGLATGRMQGEARGFWLGQQSVQQGLPDPSNLSQGQLSSGGREYSQAAVPYPGPLPSYGE